MEWPGRSIPAAKLPRHLVKMYGELAFSPYIDIGGYAYQSFREWQDVSNHVMTEAWQCTQRLTDPGFKKEEQATIEKMAVCWRDKGYGSLVQHEELRVHNQAQADALRPYFRRRGLAYERFIRTVDEAWLHGVVNNAMIPVAKGKGSPYWITRTNRDAVAALAWPSLNAESVKELDGMIAELGQAVVATTITAYLRIQGSRKESNGYGFNGYELIPNADNRVRCKTRKVQGMPFSYNFALLKLGAVTREVTYILEPWHVGVSNWANRLATTRKFVVALDLSSYDETNAGETITCYNEEVNARICSAMVHRGVMSSREARLALELMEHINSLDIITPPHNVLDGAQIVGHYGGIVSGIRLTSTMGTHINADRMQERRDGEGLIFDFCNFGDDTLAATDDERTAKKLAEASERLGYRETKADDPSYLARRTPGNVNYFSRLLLSSVNREVRHEPGSKIQCAAGLRIRNDLLTGHPLQDDFIRILKTCPGRLAEAAKLAEHSSTAELVLAAASETSGRSDDKSEGLAELIEGLIQSGKIQEGDRETLTLAYNKAVEGQKGSWLDISTAASVLGFEGSRKVITNASYTVRKSGG